MSLVPTLLALLVAAPTPLPTPLASPLPGPPASLPKASRHVLANGLRVVLIESRAAPWLEVRLGFRIGSASDPAGRSGLASLTGGLLTAGVPGRDEQAIAQELARLGASLDVEVEPDTTLISGQVLTIDAADARRFLDLVAEVALAATLPEDALERHRVLMLANVKNLVDNPTALCQAVARAAALNGLPEGRPGFGTLTDLAAITRAEVIRWRDLALAPQHAVLIVAGSLEPDAMLAWVAERFGGWGQATTCRRADGLLPGTCAALCVDGACLDNPTAVPRARRRPAAARPERALLVAMDDPNMEQAEWRWALPNPVPVMDPAWGALRLGTHVLGGEFTSRLNRTLREQEGLTYGAYLSPDFGGWESGVMAITTDATPAALPKSLALGVGLWRGMTTDLVPVDELEAIRQTLVNGFPFRFETVSHTLDQYTFVELADIPYAYLERYREALADIGPEAVRAAMQAAASAEPPVLVVVGPAALEPALAPYGPTRVVRAIDFLTHGL